MVKYSLSVVEFEHTFPCVVQLYPLRNEDGKEEQTDGQTESQCVGFGDPGGCEQDDAVER